MGGGHDHVGAVAHEKPLWWAFGLTLAFLAAEVIGGIVSSTLLTLLVLPALYRWLHRDGDGDVAALPVEA